MENQVNKPDKKKIFSTILTVIECVIIAVCLVFSIIVIAQPGEIAKKGTTNFLPVQTDSMTPTIPVGALVITQDTSDENYKIGTIVTFVVNSSVGKYLDTHRIVGYQMKDGSGNLVKIYGKNGSITCVNDILSKPENVGYTFNGYITRGDKYTVAYGSMDDFGYSKNLEELVTEFDDKIVLDHSDVIRVYKSHINGIGGVLTWFMKPTNFFIVILIPLIALFAYNVYGVVRLVIKMKVAKVKEETKVDEDEIRRRVLAELQAQGVQVPVQAEENKVDGEEKLETENQAEINSDEKPEN